MHKRGGAKAQAQSQLCSLLQPLGKTIQAGSDHKVTEATRKERLGCWLVSWQ